LAGEERLTGVNADADIYLKFRDQMLRFATSLVGPSRSEDVVSTVVVRVIQRQPLSEIDDPRAYLMKAILNESRSVWRRQKAQPLPESLVGELPGEVVETLDVVWRLPVQQRAVVYLFYWEGNSVNETAELMGLSPGTVKRYLHNARKRLESDLE
jgi:RNA polymerase sigma-70 factor (ECF subfamily)